MEFIRIGEKLINRNKIIGVIDKILKLRSQGLSQQDVANQLNLDRSFISRLEGIGEVRKGQKIAVIGFPILNKDEILDLLEKESVDFALIMTEEERWRFVVEKNGIELFNEIMNLILKVRSYDVVIIIGSNKRVRIIEALLDKEVIGLEIGESPLEEDKYVSPDKISEIIWNIKQAN